MIGYLINSHIYFNDSQVSILSVQGEYFFSLTNTAINERNKGNVEVILKTNDIYLIYILYFLSKKSNNSPEKQAVKRVPTDTIPKKKVTFELAEDSSFPN